jgi:hypothetical protein
MQLTMQTQELMTPAPVAVSTGYSHNRSDERVRARRIPEIAPPVPPRIVVVCDGTIAGDSAPRLADAISRSTSAIVRAVTWLPTTDAGAIHLVGSTPIESFLDGVTQQLYRTTAMPGNWRLELLMGDPLPGLTRICREEVATLIVMPSHLCRAGIGPQLRIIPAEATGDFLTDLKAVCKEIRTKLVATESHGYSSPTVPQRS